MHTLAGNTDLVKATCKALAAYQELAQELLRAGYNQAATLVTGLAQDTAMRGRKIAKAIARAADTAARAGSGFVAEARRHGAAAAADPLYYAATLAHENFVVPVLNTTRLLIDAYAAADSDGLGNPHRTEAEMAAMHEQAEALRQFAHSLLNASAEEIGAISFDTLLKCAFGLGTKKLTGTTGRIIKACVAKADRALVQEARAAVELGVPNAAAAKNTLEAIPTGLKAAAEQGAAAAKQAFETIEKNPQLVTAEGGMAGAVREVGEQLASNTGSVLSKSQVKHISKHIPSNFAEQIKHLSRERLTATLAKRTFFNPAWSKAKVLQAIEEGYQTMRRNGLTGVNQYNFRGEVIEIYIKADGALDSAWGLHKLSTDYFIK